MNLPEPEFKRVCVHTKNGIDYGFVRYFGHLDNKNGLYVGIEWDDAARGIHNGLFQGKRFFTSKFKTGASFVPYNKVDFGKTLLSALKEKYSSGINLKFASVNDQRINEGFNSNDIVELKKFQDLKELELQNNLLHRWEYIFQLLGFFNLFFLDLSRNKMDSLPSQFPKFPFLRKLILNDTSISEETLSSLSSVFPNLEEIELAKNNIFTASNICKFEQLVVLNLQWNAISYWSQINFLKSLKSLRVLLLDGNQIRGVFYAGGFENLEVLSLNDCLLESNKISDLSNFISLKDFSVARNPFLYEVADQYVARSILIAENRNIVKLNNSEILREERKEAELFYINFLAKQFYADEENFMTNQKTFARLVGQYGKPANPLRISPMLSTIEVCFTYNNKDDVRNVPRGMEISKLKFFVKRIFGVPPRIQKLKLFDPEDGRNFDLEDDQNLDSFSLGNKATIIVECD